MCFVRVCACVWQESDDVAEGHEEADDGEEVSDEDGISAVFSHLCCFWGRNTREQPFSPLVTRVVPPVANVPLATVLSRLHSVWVVAFIIFSLFVFFMYIFFHFDVFVAIILVVICN